MPYRWSDNPPDAPLELRLWPHNSLPPQGFAAMVLGFFLFATIPLYWLIGTMLFWGMLPFVVGAVAALYYALHRNGRDRNILEVLTLSPQEMHLTRTDPGGARREWMSNTYWVRVSLHPKGGPVPNYVTMKGDGREVEIGAFLSEDERKALFTELDDRVRRLTRD
ncbi:DUF2244 domain-containing protein [Thetidibacter halocola]|uniref:DUF2244 domain-containing protein n=1 Tax=Thetidibacter halocola TaxID=2827239 RepID=A0A8J7WBJ3_9RHOB|nr:DUF2244 domain-containing protein [Thetidibacter halocola]MBS0124525.1 DUF2244 domain-containing protein [Thetidibacter halocola]